tara:strand:+ start:60 stop:476 length:417 start_codon:yes stop_codon:yes gene_type:complete
MSKEIEIVSFVMPWHFESGEYSSGKRGKPFYIRCFGYWNPEYTSETRLVSHDNIWDALQAPHTSEIYSLGDNLKVWNSDFAEWSDIEYILFKINLDTKKLSEQDFFSMSEFCREAWEESDKDEDRGLKIIGSDVEVSE